MNLQTDTVVVVPVPTTTVFQAQPPGAASPVPVLVVPGPPGPPGQTVLPDLIDLGGPYDSNGA